MANIVGSSGVFEDMQSEAVWNEFGLCSVTYYYSGPYDQLDSQVSTSKGGFPIKSARKTRGEGGIGTIAVTYEGVPVQTGTNETGAGGKQVSASTPRYSCKISTFASKIETHPKFPTFAGKFGAPKNGAWFDVKSQLFLGFRGTQQTSDGTEGTTPTIVTSTLTGVTSYEEVGVIWEETRVHTTSDSIAASDSAGSSKVGTVVSSPTGWGKIGINVGYRNWLFMGADIDQLGYGYKMVKKWRLSGIGGWNPLIYDASS